MVVKTFIGLIIVAVVIIGFDLLAFRFGSESRDGSDWNPHADGIQDAAGAGRLQL